MGLRTLITLLLFVLAVGTTPADADPCSGSQPQPPPTTSPDMVYGDVRSGPSGDGRYAVVDTPNGSYVYADASSSQAGAGHHLQVGSAHVDGSYHQYGTVGPDIRSCTHTHL